MKKISAFILALAMLFGFVACGENNNITATSDADTAESEMLIPDTVVSVVETYFADAMNTEVCELKEELKVSADGVTYYTISGRSKKYCANEADADYDESLKTFEGGYFYGVATETQDDIGFSAFATCPEDEYEEFAIQLKEHIENFVDEQGKVNADVMAFVKTSDDEFFATVVEAVDEEISDKCGCGATKVKVEAGVSESGANMYLVSGRLDGQVAQGEDFAEYKDCSNGYFILTLVSYGYEAVVFEVDGIWKESEKTTFLEELETLRDEFNGQDVKITRAYLDLIVQIIDEEECSLEDAAIFALFAVAFDEEATGE